MRLPMIRTAMLTLWSLGLLLSILHPVCVLAYAESDKEFDPNSLYGSDRVSNIEITIEPEQWDKLRLQKRDFTDSLLEPSTTAFDNFHADISIDGFKISNIGIRKKGFFGSVDDEFPSLKVKFDEYVKQSPMGTTKRLTLNNNKQDPSLISQYMAYRFFNQAGVPAPRVGFANVSVNGKQLGVYSVIETVDKTFLSANFGTNSGDLLEGTLSDFSKKSLKRMDFKSGEHRSSDQWRVNELADLIQSDLLDLEKLGQLIDMDQFYRFWATESLLASWDGYNANQNNFFVYDDPKTNRLHFMPWGADSLWSSMAGPFGGFSKPIESVYANSLLSNRLFKTESGREGYRKMLTKLLDEHWDEDALKSKVDEMGEFLKPHLHARQKNATSAQKDMKRFIDARRKRIARELEKWPVTIPDKPRNAAYNQEVGSVSGDFSTYWQRSPKGKESTGTLSLRLEDEDIELQELKVTSKRFAMGFMGFGAPPESLPPVVEFVGKSPDGIRFVLTLSFENANFLPSRDGKKKVKIRGSVTKDVPGQPGGGPMGGPNMRFLQGTAELTEASTEQGAPVIGSFEAKIMRLVGGLFGG